jgi:hypothetical protein
VGEAREPAPTTETGCTPGTAPTVAPSRERGGLSLFWKQSPWPSIWSVRPDGSRLRWAYRTHQNAKRPTLSPDRKWIAFDGAAPGKAPPSDFDVEIVRRDGTGLRAADELAPLGHGRPVVAQLQHAQLFALPTP